MQDASFITAEPGHAPADMTRKQARTRRNRDLGKEGAGVPIWVHTPDPARHGQPAHPPDRDHHRVIP